MYAVPSLLRLYNSSLVNSSRFTKIRREVHQFNRLDHRSQRNATQRKNKPNISTHYSTTTSLASIDHSWSPHPPAGGPCTSICLYPTPFARAETPLAIPNSISHSDPPSNFGTQNSTFEFDREKLTKVCRTVLLPLPRDLAFCIAVLGE